MIGIEEARRSLFTWYTRVPSESNIADGPSRLSFDLVKRLGAIVDDFTVPEDIVAGELGEFGPAMRLEMSQILPTTQKPFPPHAVVAAG